jgi:O-antigen/teichoic acid export membrane protein
MGPLKPSQRIIKNALSGVVAEGVGSLLHFFTFILIARSLSLTDFGTFSFLVAFAGVFQLAADFGLSNILVREMTTQQDRMTHLFGAAKSLIWVLFVSVGLVLIMVTGFLDFTPQVRLLAILMGLASLILFHMAGYTAVFRAQEDMEYNALGYVLHKLILLGLVVGALAAGTGLPGVVAAHLLTNLLIWLFYYLVVRARYFRPGMHVDRALWKLLLVKAFPLGGGMVLRQAAWQVDILLLTALSGLAMVGLFSGPYRMMMALNLLPLVLALPLFPVYARLALEDPGKFLEAYRRSAKFFLTLSLPLSALIFVYAEPLIHTLLGAQYSDSSPALRLMSLSLVPLFGSALFPYLFTSLGRQRLFLWAAAAGLAIRAGLNLLLIPQWGYLGACMAVVLGETALTVVGVSALHRLGQPLHLGSLVWRPLIGVALMGSVLYFSLDLAPAFRFSIGLIGMAVYPAALLLLKAFSDEEIRFAKEGLGFLKPGRS